MATKKQKHEAAMAKRERWVAEQRESGLRALKENRENRDNKLRQASQEKHDKEHSWKKIDKNCIHCQDLLKAQRQQSKRQEKS